MGYAVAEIQTRSQIFQITENGNINDVFVEEEFRKTRYSQYDFERTQKKWFKIKKVQYVELSVLAKNEIGKKTWVKFGFDAYEIKERVEMTKFNIT